MSKETFRKKLEYGDTYCEKHDRWNTTCHEPVEGGIRFYMGCSECNEEAFMDKLRQS